MDIPWARKGSGFTLLFEALAMALIEKEMPVNKVGHLLKENPHRIWTIFNHWINLAYQADDLSSVTQLGFDETSRRKGHKYVTVAVDLEQRRVLHVVKGKGTKTIKDTKEYLQLKNVEPEQITQASIDLSQPLCRVSRTTFLRQKLPLTVFTLSNYLMKPWTRFDNKKGWSMMS